MSYAVRLLPRAKRDLRSIFRYIETHSPDGAVRWEQAFEAGLERLRDNPLICGFAPETNQVESDLRQLFFKTRFGRTYRAVYHIDGDDVIVARVCGPGQTPLSADELASE